MPRGRIAGIMAALLSFVALIGAQGNSPAELYDRGVQQQEDRKFSEAINTYQQIVSRFSSNSDRIWVARALTQMGFAYMDQNKEEAQKVCQQVIKDYKDLGERITSNAQDCIAKASAPDGVLEIPTEYTGDPYAFAISPDGRSIVMQGRVEGKWYLLLHQIETGRKTIVPGSQGGGRFPFWKPDGRSIGFFANSKLKRVDVEGSSFSNLMELAETTTDPFGGAWSNSGVIIYSAAFSSPIYRIPEQGKSAPVAVTRIAGTQTDRFPQFAPDGRHFLYFHFLARIGQKTLMLGSLDTQETRTLTLPIANGVQAAVFDSPNRLLFVDNGALLAQNLDSQMNPMGMPIQIIDQVSISPQNPGVAALSVSNGRIAYKQDTAGRAQQFKWVDRTGQPKGSLGEPDKTMAAACCFRLSPDDKTVVYQRRVGGGPGSLWTMSTVNGVRSSEPFAVIGVSPAWSKAGDQIAFGNYPPPRLNSKPNLFQKRVAVGAGDWLRQSPDEEHPNDWHGNFLLFRRSSDLFVLPLEGGDRVIPVANSPANELNGRFSPDGNWIVYQSGEAGDRFEIYVQAFPGSASARQKVSRDGARMPQWRRKDGREIYFLSSDNWVMAASVTPSADGRNIEIGAPVALFEAPVGANFDASSDGERFLISAGAEEAAPPIRLKSNWASALNSSGAPSARPSQPAQPTSATVGSGEARSNTAAVVAAQSVGSLWQITILDRDGNRLGTVGSPGPSNAIAISPDATRVAFSRGTNLFVVDTSTDTTAAITSTRPTNANFGFSPDSKRIAYISNDQNAGVALYTKFSNGTGSQQRRYSPATNFSNWSMDLLMFNSGNSQLALPFTGNTTPVSHVIAGGNTPLRLSPDSRFIAYLSNDDGSPIPQLWVRPFNPSSAAPPPAATKITTDGVMGMIRWRADGQELYFLSGNGGVVAVPITSTPEIKVGTPTVLFRVPPAFVQMSPTGRLADVSADGQRFIFLLPVPDNGPSDIRER